MTLTSWQYSSAHTLLHVYFVPTCRAPLLSSTLSCLYMYRECDPISLILATCTCILMLPSSNVASYIPSIAVSFHLACGCVKNNNNNKCNNNNKDLHIPSLASLANLAFCLALFLNGMSLAGVGWGTKADVSVARNSGMRGRCGRAKPCARATRSSSAYPKLHIRSFPQDDRILGTTYFWTGKLACTHACNRSARRTHTLSLRTHTILCRKRV